MTDEAPPEWRAMDAAHKAYIASVQSCVRCKNVLSHVHCDVCRTLLKTYRNLADIWYRAKKKSP